VSFLTGVFIIILAGIGVAAITEISKAIIGRGARVRDLAEFKLRLEQQDAALQEAQDTLADQSAQLAELQERVDFAERLLAQAREKPALGAGAGQPRS
jgi:F0F1-type ATP synthase membrane subunit b/b'